VPIYLDTSAFAKRYLNERGSQAFDDFLRDCTEELVVSPLGATELESVLQRLKRQGLVDAAFVRRAREAFHADLAAALWSMRPFEASSFEAARGLMRSLDAPLATLDALHLASAIDFGCDAIATGDIHLSRAADKRGLIVHGFIV
jgi:predicted nucleic acid-binding protein